MEIEIRKISKGSKEYYRAIIALFMGSLIAFGAEYCVQPIIPVIAVSFQLDPALASLAVSAGTGGMAIAMLLIAGLAQRLARKWMMIEALVGAAIMAILIALSQSFGFILGIRFLQGIMLAAFPAMAVAYICEEFEATIIGTAVGIYVSGTSIGGLAGRMILSALTDWFSWRHALIGLSLLYLSMAVLFIFLLPKPRMERAPRTDWGTVAKGFKNLLLNKRIVLLYAIAAVCMGSFVCTYNFISFVLLAPPYELSQLVIGFVFLLYLVGTVSSTVMGMMADRFGNGPILCISIICMLIGNGLSYFVPLWMKIFSLGVFTYGFFGAHSVACSWAGRIGNADKAQISSLYMFFYYIGASVFGSWGGVFLTHFGWHGIIAFLTCLLLAALMMAYTVLRWERNDLLAN